MTNGTAGRGLRDADGYAPIESYAVLGDGRTVACLAADGRVDWWPVPTLDAPPAFAAILDADRGGAVTVQPVGEFTVRRAYVTGTNVVETTFETETGAVVVTDALSTGVAGPLPWGELVRRIRGVRGHVEMCWEVAPGDRFQSARPWTVEHRHCVVCHLGDQHLAVQAFDLGPVVTEHRQVGGRFTTAVGSSGLLAVTASDAEPLYLPDRDQLESRLEATIARWREWTAGVEYDGDWSEAVIRSSLALKTLLYSPTGAIAAAATTSLPERIGGDKNWDYRYMWVRDSSFTVDALMALGLHEEVQSAISFVLGAIRGSGGTLQVFYKLDGEIPDQEEKLDAPGYRHSQPVRSGNGAASQTQLGTFGDLFDTMWRYVCHGHLLDPDTARLLEELADRCCDIWRQPDAGIWELDDYRHYTISKMGCWVALDRAFRMAERGDIVTAHADRWSAERDLIKRFVHDHCWSDTLGSYTFYAGTDELDAATLLAGHTGFECGERLNGTIDAVRRELADGPLVYRYTGMRDQEGAFLACTFWLVGALASAGRRDEARRLMAEAVALVNDVGLLSEQMDPSTRAMLGNFPQGLSHLALINAAQALAAKG